MANKPKTTRRCAWCAVKFTVWTANQATVHCSITCAQRRRYDRDRSRIRPCEICGKTYRYSYPKQRTCGRACGVELRNREDNYHRVVKPVAPPRECSWCGRPGLTRHSTICSRAMETRTRRSSPVEYGTCAECGEVFVRRAGSVGAFCSLRCAHRVRKRDDKHKRKALAVVGDRISLAKLGERDGWRCHICKRRVGKQRGNTPNAASIDHLVPTSHGGQHVWSNVALAHRSCNGRRSNTGPAQLLLA